MNPQPYTIETNHWTGTMEPWRHFASEKAAMRAFAYMRFAYPNANTTLLHNNYIVSTSELAELAKHLILDDAPEAK